MPSKPLQIEIPGLESQSHWPWIVALLAGAGMLASVAQILQTIPANLERTASGIVSQANFSEVTVNANGRDLVLQGRVPSAMPVGNLIDRLRNIEGVRTIQNEVTVFDPVQLVKDQRDSFIRAITQLDLSAVSFDPGSTSLSTGSTAGLERLAALMTEYDTTRIRIEGHTDNTGPESVNLRISRDRAQAVANFLLNRGISGDRMIARGYGSTQPIASNDTESGRATNRRIEISYVN